MSRDNPGEHLSVRQWPFYWLTRATTRYLDAIGSALDGSGLDLPSWRVVMTLREAGWLSVSEIAAQANSKLATMTKTVQRMRADGFVDCREGDTDRRVTLVSLTPAGRAAAERAAAAAEHVFRRAFHDMPAQKRDDLTRLLRDVAENLR
jgi:DNA-binding MarR family transcriptional regulator